jgi:hypothetical protein
MCRRKWWQGGEQLDAGGLAGLWVDECSRMTHGCRRMSVRSSAADMIQAVNECEVWRWTRVSNDMGRGTLTNEFAGGLALV